MESVRYTGYYQAVRQLPGSLGVRDATVQTRGISWHGLVHTLFLATRMPPESVLHYTPVEPAILYDDFPEALFKSSWRRRILPG